MSEIQKILLFVCAGLQLPVFFLLHITELFSPQRQRCSAPTFSCQFNDPCDPQCVPGQHQYPGRSARGYVECVEGRCTEQQCPRRTTWDQASQMCTGGNG